jgi:hypothetical protein
MASEVPETNVFATPAAATPAASPSPSALLSPGAAAATDWLKGPRRWWNAAVGFIAQSQVATHVFVLLPSLYLSGVLIYISTGLGASLCAGLQSAATPSCVAAMAPITNAVLSAFGVLAGLTYVVLIPAEMAVYWRWPGVLSLSAWATGVMGNWFVMTLVLFTLAATNIFAQFTYLPGNYATAFLFTFMRVLWGVFLPACFVWGLSAEVMAKRRLALSGE